MESDEPQVTVNQRYEVFFPEKRPFFLENAGFFMTPERLFFSRRIVDPRFGARLTGKVGKWSLGALVRRRPRRRARTSRPATPSSRSTRRSASSGCSASSGAAAATPRIGAMATSQDFGPTYNRVFSLDTRLQLLRNWIFTGQAISQQHPHADGPDLAGPAYCADWRHYREGTSSPTRRYTDLSPNFRARPVTSGEWTSAS